MKSKILEILSKDISDSEKADLIIAEVNSSASAPLEERREAFINSLKPYVETYGKEMVNEFYRYWGATSTRGKLMAFEKEKSWNLPSRLNKWRQNSQKFKIVNMLKKK